MERILLKGIWVLWALFTTCGAVFAQMQGVQIGLYAIDEKGKVVANRNGETTMVPASVTKVLTTAAVIDMYGADATVETAIEYSGTISSEGTLTGNLYIKGYGDPSLGSVHFGNNPSGFLSDWCSAISKKGIKRIKGAVIADESCFDTEGVSAKWLLEDMGNYYAAGAYGLSVFDNSYTLYLKSGAVGSPVKVVRTSPDMKEIKFSSYAIAKGNQKDSIYIHGAPFSNIRTLYGSMPASKTAFKVKGDIPDPALYLASLLTEQLTTKGIIIEGTPSTWRLLSEKGKWKEQEERKRLYETESPKLSEIVKTTNTISNNHFCEHLIRLVGLQKYKQSSAIKGIEVAKEHFRKKGVDDSREIWVDGSGLSPMNRLSPKYIVEVLYAMRRSKWFTSFEVSLPVAGNEGTARNFLKSTPLEGKVRTKSGSISGVQCYVGYANIGSKRYTFAIMLNGFNCERKIIQKEIENILVSTLVGE